MNMDTPNDGSIECENGLIRTIKVRLLEGEDERLEEQRRETTSAVTSEARQKRGGPAPWAEDTVSEW